jgi:glycosyltransferase involved in cell wall biosynthesis
MIEFGFNEDNIEYIPNFIDTDRFKYNYKDEGYALFIGRLSSEKGIEILLETCAMTPEIPVIIAGTGPLELELRNTAKERQLSNVTFVGFKSGDELLKLITNASFSILPSQVYENCPMSILESMAVGTPVLGASIGGIPELIRENIDGYTFDATSPASLADKMKILWANPDLRSKMGAEAARRIRQKHIADRHYEQLMQVYNSVLQNKHLQ